jgi:hypothetical protein
MNHRFSEISDTITTTYIHSVLLNNKMPTQEIKCSLP